MIKTGVKLYSLSQETGFHVLEAVVERLINYALQGVEQPLGLIYSGDSEVEILGYYLDGEQRKGLYRRFTGGPRYIGSDYSYLALVIPNNPRIDDLYSLLNQFLGEKGIEHHGGRIGGSGVYGVTKFGEAGLVEIILPAEEATLLEELLEWGFSGVEREIYNVRGFEKYRGLEYLSSSWIGYRAGEGDISVSCSGNGFWMRLSLYLHEIYIRDARIVGSFYAAPPSAPYNVMAFFKGAQINELIFYQAENTWLRMEYIGVDRDTLSKLFNEAYTLADKYILDSR